MRPTNNDTNSFEFIIYALDYSQLHSQDLPVSVNSSWIELSSNDVVLVVSNDINYGQKVQLSLVDFDTIELEVDASNTLIVN